VEDGAADEVGPRRDCVGAPEAAAQLGRRG
jgi:hypothetical protein